MKKDVRWLWIFRCFFAAIVLAVLLYCSIQYFAVTGHITLTQDFNTDNESLISLFIPYDRAGDIIQNRRTGETAQAITEAPVYFTAKIPRAFDSVTATMQYSTQYRGPISFGVVELLNPLAVKEMTIDVPLVREAIADHWQIVADKNTGNTVYSKTGLSFSQIQNRAKQGDSIMVVNADLGVPYRDSDYVAKNESYTIPYALRGGHTFFVYIKDESVYFSTDVIDENISGGSDPMSVVLMNENNEVVESKRFSDDGNETANRQSAEQKNITITKSNLPEGVYRVIVQATNDVVLQNITTEQKKFVVKDRIAFGTRDQSVDLLVGSDVLTAQTASAESFQDIVVGDRLLPLNERQTAVELDGILTPEDQYTPVHLAFGDVALSFPGYAAFSPDAYFDPDFAIQAANAKTKLSDVAAIVTKDFVPPTENYRGLEATVELPLSGVLTDRKKLEFIINAQELLSQKEDIMIDSVKLEFHRASLWSRLIDRFSH